MSGIEGVKGGVHDQKQHVVDSPIPECFKPDPKHAKTTMEGRVTYDDVDYDFLTGQEMRKVGEKVAKAFPSFKVWVTGGPWKGYDVKHQVDLKNKIISIDFYSPRPGLQYIPEIILAIKGHLKERGVAPKPFFYLLGVAVATSKRDEGFWLTYKNGEESQRGILLSSVIPLNHVNLNI